jgi:hypothetical protein
MSESFTFWLIVLAVLIAYLCVSVGLRLRAEAARRRARESQSPGTAFDASAIAPQMQRLRQDYVAAAHSRQPHSSYRAKLVAKARQIVKGLAYFRHTKSEEEL